MSDVDDELLALIAGGSSSSRSSSPDAQRRKRRRPAGGSGGRRGKRDDSDEEEDDRSDAEGSDEDDDEPVNPYRLEGIYKDEQDRERLLRLPEFEREAELAARRDEVTQRRQKADLRAMVRSQQTAGRASHRPLAPRSKAKPRKLKKASTVKRRKRSDSDEDDAFDQEDDDDEDDDEEEEEEESDYGTSRRRGSARTRKAVGKTSSKSATLQKLKQSRAKAQRRRQGGGAGDDDSSSGAGSESEYDAEEAEALWRRKKERERRDRGDGPKRDQKASREQERLARHGEWFKPTLNDINAARLRRDHFTRLMHRPDWMAQLAGKFARINYTHRERGNGRTHTSYRLVRIIDCRAGEKYYEVGANDQLYTNAVCDMRWGDETMRSVPLQFVSNSAITQQEYEEWSARVEALGPKMHRSVPSREETQDQAEDLEAFINRPFTEQDINQMLQAKKQARQAYHAAVPNDASGKPRSSGHNGDFASAAGYNEILMAQMNEKHRKADRERIVDAERRNALQAKLAAQRIANGTPANGTPALGTPALGTPGNNTPKPTSPRLNTNISLAAAAAAVEVDLGDF